MTYSASSLAALGLQNLPLLSILGSISLEDETESVDSSTIWPNATAEVLGIREEGGLGNDKSTPRLL